MYIFLTGPLNFPESVVIFNFRLERPELVCGNFGSKLELPPDEAGAPGLCGCCVSQCLRVNTLIKPGKWRQCPRKLGNNVADVDFYQGSHCESHQDRTSDVMHIL